MSSLGTRYKLFFSPNSDYLQLLRNLSVSKASYTCGMREDICLWKELVFSRMHVNCSPDSLKRWSELGCVTDIFSGILSAPDNLSDQRLSMVCVVTMLLMNFVWVHSPWRDLWPTDVWGCDLVWPEHTLPHSWKKFPGGRLLVSIYPVATFSFPAPQRHSPESLSDPDSSRG